MSKRVLIVTGDGGEAYETWFAVHRFQEAGYETRVAAPSKRRLHLVMHDFEPGWDTYKESPGYAIESDLTFADVVVRDYDAVVCIGGRAPEYLRNDPRVLAILREFDVLGKWIFTICHGVQLAAAAGLVRGKQVTCYEHVRLEVESCGGTYVARDTVRDGRLVSSPTWREHPAFYKEVFSCLAEPVTA
ncbi:MAG TPA: DJ-1/PfpI family protein [Vicinamibacterales bacterium]|nr:DJ-1/PfpI family protein [Vicinamibacterales bacterium]